jgi:hypothetical protein
LCVANRRASSEYERKERTEMAKKITVIEPIQKDIRALRKRKLRVCAYVRVSTGSDAQANSFITMLNSVVTVFVFRMIWLEFIYPPLEAIEHTIDNVYLCYTFSWSLTFIAHLVAFLIVFIRYMKTGKTKNL